MKKIYYCYCFAFLQLLSLTMQGQNVCYSFDDTIIADGTAQQNAFNDFGNGHPGFLQDWVVVSGTPSLEPAGALIRAGRCIKWC